MEVGDLIENACFFLCVFFFFFFFFMGKCQKNVRDVDLMAKIGNYKYRNLFIISHAVYCLSMKLQL